MKITDLKAGDWVKINDDGITRNGTVVRVSSEEQEVYVDNGIQEYWYSLGNISAVPLDEQLLMQLGFEKKEVETGAKYGKDAFRIWVPAADDFSRCEMWYREDRRHFDHQLMVHELQNSYLDMTKMPLDPPKE